MSTFLRLTHFLKPYAAKIALSVLAGAGTVGSSVLLLGTSAFLISKAALQPSIAELQVAIVGVRFFGICRGLFRYLERLLSHSVNLRVLSHLRLWFFRQIEPLVPARLISYRGGDLLSRAVHDIETLENFFIRLAAPPLVWVVITSTTALYLGSFSSQAALIYLAGSLVAGVVLPMAAYLSGKAVNLRARNSYADFNSALLDYHQGYTDLLMAGRANEKRAALETAGYALLHHNARLSRVNAAFMAIHLGVSNLVMVAVLAFGAWLASQALIDPLYLSVLALVTVSSFEASQAIMTGSTYLHGNIEAGQRLFEIAEQPPAAAEPAAPKAIPAWQTMRADGLAFSYLREEPLLAPMNISITRGEHIAILGPSGSGKTTLANLLVRFLEPTHGRLLWDDMDFVTISGEDTRAEISLMPQLGYVFAGSLRDNLRMGRETADDQALTEALDVMALTPWFERLPHGLDSELGENGAGMSAGERQRLTLARVLLRESPVLLLDEPTANLDPVTARDIRQRVLGASQGRTVLWITHSLAGLEAFDRLLIFSQGKIVEQGSHRQLSEAAGTYQRLLELQSSLLQ